MSYEVTATRRRPQRLNDLVGQEFVAETLKNSINSGKIAHAYLFSGPRGCGKTSTARILAKALNCQNGPTADPCCHCSNCEEITKGTSLDVIEIDGASNTSVENIRQIKDEVLFPPANCRYKIYIIDEVHMLSTSAFNALLKTIEEPPAYVIFIFATTELQKVPATIKSRCQQFNFRLVAIEKVKQCLADAAAELNIQADEEALFWIARESTGSMRDAYTLFDQVVAFSDGHITYEKIRDKLGLVGIERLNTIFEACAANEPDKVINLLDEFLQGGISIEQLISNCADYLRSLMLIKSGVTKESLLGNSVERYSQKVLNAWNPVQIERALSLYLQLYRDIRYSLSPRYELELLFSRLCWISQYVSNVEVKKAIDAAQALLCGAPSSAPAAANPNVNTGIVANANPGFSVPKTVSSPVVNNSAPVMNQQVQPPVQKAPESNSFDAFSRAFDSAGSGMNSTEAQKIPNGLPRLSMFDELVQQENSANAAQGDVENPFLNGGSLPPEQTVKTTEIQATEKPDQQNKSLDNRLIINIPTQNVKEDDIVPTVELPSSDSDFGYSLNPDEDDSGWANVDEAPPEAYYDENEMAEQAEQTYENFMSPVAEPAPSLNNQVTEQLVLAGKGPVSLQQLHNELINVLTAKDSFAATALEKTLDWKLGESVILAKIYTQYDLSILEKKLPVINGELSSLLGKQFSIQVSLKQRADVSAAGSAKELPVQVSILKNVFKGSIV